MAEEIRATTQYGDMTGEISGTISVDGWNGLTAARIGLPAMNGYWPVGIQICMLRSSNGEFNPDIYALGVDMEILDDPRNGADAVGRYAKAHGQIPVFHFPTDCKLRDLLPLLKRLDVVLQIKSIGDANLVLVDGDK